MEYIIIYMIATPPVSDAGREARAGEGGRGGVQGGPPSALAHRPLIIATTYVFMISPEAG